jgi:DNA repair photolyase
MNINFKDIESKSILTPASGYLTGYTHSLNPYAGCSFSCSYCYVREMPINKFRSGEDWGTWVDKKINAADLLKKELTRERKMSRNVVIFMSSSTDPYQPIEVEAKITRGLLKVMIENMPDFLFVQTRAPLVTRDIDFLKKFGDSIRVSITIETDLDQVRKIFTPSAPPIAARMKALQRLTEAGIPTQAAISPVLPCSKDFPQFLKRVTNRVIIDDFFMGDGSNGKRTERMGIRNLFEVNGYEDWYDKDAYKKVITLIKSEFPEADQLISQKGFMPK